MDCDHCGGEAVLWLSERYEAADGVGAVERMEAVCADCAAEAGPEGLGGVYANYEYHLDPIPEAFGMVETE